MPQFDDDRFRYLDKVTVEKGGVSVKEAAKAFGLSERSTITWLCRWENYYNVFRDIVQHFLTRIPGNPPLYKTGPDWWGERYNRGMGENWHDVLDVSGINSLHVSLGFIKTRTDSVTHKRTLKGTRATKARLKWVEDSNGVTSASFAKKFNVSTESASTILSTWRRKGLIDRIDGLWVVKGNASREREVVLKVEGYVDEDARRHVKEVWQTVEREKPAK